VDYPTVALRDISTDTRKHLPETDFAGKGRSFPIEKPEDVDAAARSIGQAGEGNYSTDELKKNIIAIANRKGKEFTAKLPDAWKAAMDDVEMCDQPKTAMSDAGPQYYVRLGEVTDGLKRIPIAILGRFVKGTQKFAITKQALTDLVANFRKRTAETVIDYEHASEFPEAAKGQPIPAAGWIKALDDQPDADGVLWGSAEFTERARTMLAAKEYRYFSPVIEWRRDKHTGEAQGATLVSAALTNRPFLDEMPAIAMSDRWKQIDRGDAAIEGGKVKVTKLILADRAAGTVRAVLEDGTEVTAVLEGLEAQPKVVRLSDVKRDKDGRYDFGSLPLGEGVVVLSEVFQGMAVQAALDEAMKDGKITAAQRPVYEKLALSDLAGFRTLMKTQKTVVDLGERGTGAEGLKDSQQVQVAIDAKVAEIRKARPGLRYGEALKLVASENPDLFSARNKFQKGGR
jgi:phage I-like protein